MKPATQKTFKITIFLLLLATGYSLLAPTAKAQSVEGLSAIPPRLEVTVNPDSAITKTIKVRNESDVDKTILISIEDFVVNDNIGTPTIVTASKEDNRWAASSWIQVSPSSVKLKAGETKTLNLTVMPPKNALPGGHYAMVVQSPEGKATPLNATGSTVQPRVGTLVYITIPGDITQNAVVKNFSADKFFEFGPVDFATTIQNLSDIHIKPAGNITITNMIGMKSFVQFNKDGNNIFPGKTRDFENQLNKKWLFGRYKAELKAAYGNAGGVATATVFFWVIPWRFLILVGTAIAVVIAVILIIKNKTDGSNKETEEKVDELEKELEALKKKYKDR
ncbi:MAG: hypothetical protein PHS06_01605 [Candidatus Shapirobacteria bacterium]|nr:hypothetical protein [Candidatus Shapirobacteria bacterium]